MFVVLFFQLISGSLIEIFPFYLDGGAAKAYGSIRPDAADDCLKFIFFPITGQAENRKTAFERLLEDGVRFFALIKDRGHYT